MSAIYAIQSAIASVLSGDATLVALATGGITNDKVEDQDYPYVRIGNATEKSWPGMGNTGGFNNIVRIHIYSQYEGESQALQILNRVVGLLDYQTLTVSGYPNVLCEYETCRVMNEIDPNTKAEIRHIPAEFRVRVRQ